MPLQEVQNKKHTVKNSLRKGLLQKSDFFKLLRLFNFKKQLPDPADKFYEKTNEKQ